jgi:hypothetical protein
MTRPRFSCFSIVLAPILFLAVCPLLHSQDASAQTEGKGAAAVSVTGCLQKGTEAGGFFITGEDGKDWELSGGAAKLTPHVGHKITVTGREIHKSQAQEEKAAADEKQEAGGKQYSDLRVSTVKMISDTCNS